jgi:drug/metabolite transporter (DMT)-like permease
MAARYVTAAELSLLGLVEVIIGPIWVWLLFNEMPAIYTVIGGIFVLSAVVGLAIWSMYREREI